MYEQEKKAFIICIHIPHLTTKVNFVSTIHMYLPTYLPIHTSSIHPSIHPSKYIHIGGWVAPVGAVSLGNIYGRCGWHRLIYLLMIWKAEKLKMTQQKWAFPDNLKAFLAKKEFSFPTKQHPQKDNNKANRSIDRSVNLTVVTLDQILPKGQDLSHSYK